MNSPYQSCSNIARDAVSRKTFAKESSIIFRVAGKASWPKLKEATTNFLMSISTI